MPPLPAGPLRVLVVAEHASAKFGGEAALPLHYFRVLRAKGVEAWLVVHERTRPELATEFAADAARITYIPDTAAHKALWALGAKLPPRLSYFSIGFAMRLLTQLMQRQVVKRLIKSQQINVVHQPIPVSPKEPSMLFGFGVPVVIGPMNGGMDYPPGFRAMQGTATTLGMAIGRGLSAALNVLIPGKMLAATLLVANRRTQDALPAVASKRVLELVENGVDLSVWRPGTAPREHHKETAEQRPVHFVFVGRLVDWKAVDLLLQAFQRVRQDASVSLTIVGDGAEKDALVTMARRMNIEGAAMQQSGKVFFAGWRAQAECADILAQSDALVLPSLMECGGAVVLEAMAIGRAVIATNWGGPADYLDASCGILVDAPSKDLFIHNFADAMTTLALNAELRQTMGQHGRQKVVDQFDWSVKVDRMLCIYEAAILHRTPATT